MKLPGWLLLLMALSAATTSAVMVLALGSFAVGPQLAGGLVIVGAAAAWQLIRRHHWG